MLPWDPGKRPQDELGRTGDSLAEERWQTVPCLIDSGANISAISLAEAERLRLPIAHGALRHVKLGKGWVRATGTVTIPRVTLEGKIIENLELLVIDGLNQRMVLGLDSLGRANALIDCAARRVFFEDEDDEEPALHLIERICDEGRVELVLLDGEKETVLDDAEQEEYMFLQLDLQQVLKHGFHESFQDDTMDEPQKMSRNEAGDNVSDDPRMQRIVQAYARVFVKPDSLPPSRGVYDFDIKVKPDAVPTRRSGYRYSLAEREAAMEEVKRLLKLGWIRPSSSPWSSALLFAKNRKKNGKLRAVYDYRSINAWTIASQRPVPRVQDMLQELRGSAVFTTLDVSGAFNQVLCKPTATPLTAFATPWQLYEHLVMPMGLTDGSGHMQDLMMAAMRGDPAALPIFPEGHERHQETAEVKARYIDGKEVLDDLTEFVTVFIDDICVHSRTAEAHYEHVEKVLHRLLLYDIRVNEFFKFGQASVELLGFEVSQNGIKTLESRAKAIHEWPTPRNAGEVHTFLGLANYYRETCPRFSLHSAQLTPLQSAKVEWVWGATQQAAFDAIKEGIARRIELFTPDPSKPLVLVTDASIYALGGVLLQREGGPESELRTVAFYSRQTRGGEPRYGQYALEFCALVQCVTHWRWILDGCAGLTIYVDHQPLVTGRVFDVSQTHNNSHQISRWVERISHIRATLLHHSASAATAKVADAFSRRPDYVQQTKKDLEAWIEDIKTKHSEPAQLNTLTLVQNGPTLMALRATLLERIQLGFRNADAAEMVRMGYSLQEGHWKIYGRFAVPRVPEIRDEIIADAHDQHGHPGVTATVRILRRRFYWARMHDDVAEYIRRCGTCQTTKPGNWRKTGTSHPLPIATDMWTDIEVDFIPQLPRSGEGDYTRICTVIDRRSKACILFPCKDTVTSKDFAQLFMTHVWKRKGMPLTIRTDCDTIFVADVWTEIANVLRFDPALAAPWAHQQIGQAEKMNQIVEKILRVWIEKDGSNWSELLPAVEFAYNSTPVEGLKLCPFEVEQGWIPRRGLISEQVPAATTGASALLRFEQVRAYVTERLLEMQDNAVRDDGRQWKPVVGDRVYLRAEELPKRVREELGPSDARLGRKWAGPYVILKADTNSEAVYVELPSRWRVRNPIHISRLKPCRDDRLPPVDVKIDEHGEAYVDAEVDRLYGHRCRGRGAKRVLHEINVSFAGYGSEFDRRYEGQEELRELATTAPLLLDQYVASNEVRVSKDIKVILDRGRSADRDNS